MLSFPVPLSVSLSISLSAFFLPVYSFLLTPSSILSNIWGTSNPALPLGWWFFNQRLIIISDVEGWKSWIHLSLDLLTRHNYFCQWHWQAYVENSHREALFGENQFSSWNYPLQLRSVPFQTFQLNSPVKSSWTCVLTVSGLGFIYSRSEKARLSVSSPHPSCQVRIIEPFDFCNRQQES